MSTSVCKYLASKQPINHCNDEFENALFVACDAKNDITAVFQTLIDEGCDHSQFNTENQDICDRIIEKLRVDTCELLAILLEAGFEFTNQHLETLED